MNSHKSSNTNTRKVQSNNTRGVRIFEYRRENNSKPIKRKRMSFFINDRKKTSYKKKGIREIFK